MKLQPGDRAILKGPIPAFDVLILAMTANKQYLILADFGKMYIVNGASLTWFQTQWT